MRRFYTSPTAGKPARKLPQQKLIRTETETTGETPMSVSKIIDVSSAIPEQLGRGFQESSPRGA